MDTDSSVGRAWVGQGLLERVKWGKMGDICNSINKN